MNTNEIVEAIDAEIQRLQEAKALDRRQSHQQTSGKAVT
jgi:hypothetical protein